MPTGASPVAPGAAAIRYRVDTAPAIPTLDAAIVELLRLGGIDHDADLIFEMIVTALRMGRESVGRGDLKLVNAAIKELRYSFHVFNRYRDVRKVTMFGSARTPVDHGAYRAANEFARDDGRPRAGWS